MLSKRSILCLVGLLVGAVTYAAESFSPTLFDKAKRDLAPAMCLVSYSYEVTDPQSGNTTKNNSNALGVLVSSDGLVMVRGHVAIENIEPFNIRVQVGQEDDAEEYDAHVLQKPDDVNVAFVKIDAKTPVTFPFVKFAGTSSARLGDPVLIVGMHGRTLDYEAGFFERRISAILEKPRTTICLDDPIPLGFVGGPVLNGSGQIIGVSGYDLTAGEGGELYVRSGHPLVYQNELFAKYIANPPSDTEVPKIEAWLGVFTQPLTDDLAEYWNVKKDGGVVVSTVMAGSPAQKAGFLIGDIITSFADVPIRAKQNREVLQFTKVVREAGVGTPVKVKLLRSGTPMEIDVTLMERPKTSSQAEEYMDETFGIGIREITTDLRIRANLASDVQGVLVYRVRSGSWAAMADIRPGMIIMNFGDYPITNLAEFKEAVAKIQEAKPAEVSVFCRVRQVTAFFRIQPRWGGNGQN